VILVAHLILLGVLLTLELTAAHYLTVLLDILSSVNQVMSEATTSGLRLLKHLLLVEYAAWLGTRQTLSHHTS
jgi:hypothetical protein